MWRGWAIKAKEGELRHRRRARLCLLLLGAFPCRANAGGGLWGCGVAERCIYAGEVAPANYVTRQIEPPSTTAGAGKQAHRQDACHDVQSRVVVCLLCVGGREEGVTTDYPRQVPHE